MRIDITKTKVYKFNELSDEAKQTALDSLRENCCDYEWWDCAFEDAANVSLKLTEFDLDRNRHCEGEFIESAEETAVEIIKEHGEKCVTYQTAQNYISDIAELGRDYPEIMDDEGYDENEFRREDAEHEIDCEFLKSILEDYSIMLQKEYEYLQSEEAIIETIEANEYEFTVDGEFYHT